MQFHRRLIRGAGTSIYAYMYVNINYNYNIALSAQQLSVWDFIIPTPPPQPVRLSIYDRVQYDEDRCFALNLITKV